MRLEKTVDLGDFKVVVKECTIGQIRNLLRMAASAGPQIQEFEGTLKVLDVVDEKLTELFHHLQDVVCLPAGKTPDDLTVTEAAQVWEAVTELNPKLFKKNGTGMGIQEAITTALKGPPKP
jgi:hypothetical protein